MSLWTWCVVVPSDVTSRRSRSADFGFSSPSATSREGRSAIAGGRIFIRAAPALLSGLAPNKGGYRVDFTPLGSRRRVAADFSFWPFSRFHEALAPY